MKDLLLIITVSLILASCSTAPAQSGDSPPPGPIILSDDQDEYPLGLHLEILEDPSGELTIEEVSSPEFESRFTPSQVEVPNIGFTENAYWVRFFVQNESRMTDQWLLELAFANIHFIDLYTPSPDGDGFGVKQAGTARHPETRDILHPHFVFALTIPPRSQQMIYLRIQSEASIALPIILWEPTTFFNQSQGPLFLQVLIFGALIGLLFYNLFLLVSLKEAVYLYLVISLASILLFDLAYAGFMEIYIIPNLYHLRHYYVGVSFALVFISIILFTDNFLELKASQPKLHMVNLAILGVWGVLMLLIPFTSYYVNAILMVPWALPTLIAVLVAGILSWREGFRSAQLFMVAWLGLIVFFFLVLLVRLGLLPSTSFSENAYRIGWIWMAVCWSFALADRINVANLELQSSKHRLSQILEGLPLGVVLYGVDQKPKYVNQRTIEILNNPDRDIQVDISVGRTLAQAMSYFNLQLAGSEQEYPVEQLPIYSALHGVPASVDDVVADLEDKRVPLEIWASPVFDETGNVQSAVVAFQDITQRKQSEAELDEYRKHLENLVDERTAELSAVNKELQLRLKWLSAVNLVSEIIARSADFTEIYEKIIEIINELFATEDAFIAEKQADIQKLKILAHSCRSNSHPNLGGSTTLLSGSIQSNAELKQGRIAVFSKDQFSMMSGPIGDHFLVTKIHTIALVPLQLRKRVIGFLGMEMHDTERTITPEEITLLSIFSFDIARLIEDKNLFEQTKALITAEERNRLARDLHDSVTQVLFSATLLAEVLPKIWRRNPEEGLQRLDKLRQLTRGALAEMRTMLLELRPSAVIKTPLDELLGQLTEAIASRSGLPFQLYIEKIPPLPEEMQTSFYRIAQEALNNVVKHAQAQLVTVSLSATPLPPDSAGLTRHEIKLVIQDDGVGFTSSQDQADRLGIGIMHERAASIGAYFFLESRLGYGTRVTVNCCIESEEQL